MGAPVQNRGNRRGNFAQRFPKNRQAARPPLNGFGFEPMMRPRAPFRPPMRPPMMPPPMPPRWMRPRGPPMPPPHLMGPGPRMPPMRPPMLRPPPPPPHMMPGPMGFRPRMHRVQKGRIVKRGQRRGPEIDLSKEWVTEALREEFRKKEELLKKAKGTENKDDWAVYRGQRERCSQMYHVAEMEHLGQQEVRIPQLLPENNFARVNTAPIDYTADVKL